MSSWIKRIRVIFCSCFVSCMLLVLILPVDALSEGGTSYMRWSIGCNVNRYFSPFSRANRDLNKRDYHEIICNTPQFGIEVAGYKYDAAGLRNAASALCMFTGRTRAVAAIITPR
jgi:hypothetical protein